LATSGGAEFVSVPGRVGVRKTAGNDSVLVDLVDVVVHCVGTPAQALFRDGFCCAWESIPLGGRPFLDFPHSQMLENLANYRRVFNEGDNVHCGTALGTHQRGNQIKLSNRFSELHLCTRGSLHRRN